MTTRKDDGLWRPEDYDDEPRSHGNFGLDVQQQEAKEGARPVLRWQDVRHKFSPEVEAQIDQQVEEETRRLHAADAEQRQPQDPEEPE